jgi:hypothetical protein
MKQLILLLLFGWFSVLFIHSEADAQGNCVGVQVTIERNIALSGGSDGRLRAQCTGSCACVQGYQYSLNGGPFTPNPVFDNLRAGTYTVRIIDLCTGCVSTSNPVALTQPNPCVTVSAFASRNVSTPNGNDGQITPTCNGACFACPLGYEYSLNGGTYQRTPLFNNLIAGQYKVTIRDRCSGCTSESAVVTITQPAGEPNCAGVTTFVQSPVTTQGGSDGILIANCVGNCGNCFSGFQYSINGGAFQNSNRFTNLRAGTYTVTIKNTCNNCTAVSAPVTITEPNNCTPVQANITSPITSVGGNQGIITANCVGLCNCASGYQYSINGGGFQNSPVFANLRAGTYIVTLRDNCSGCTSRSNAIVLQDGGTNNCAGVNVTVVRNVSSAGLSDAEITANCAFNCNDCPSGFQYSINGGVTFQNSNRFTGLRAGVYTVTQRNACNGCTTQSNQFVITEPQNCVGVTAQVLSNVTVEGTRSGRINATCTGNCRGCNTGYEYSLNGGPFQLSTFFPNLPSGLYTVRIRDLCSGCISTSNPVFVAEPSSQSCVRVSASVLKNVSRNGGTDGEIIAACNGICSCAIGYEYSLNGTTYQSNPTFSNLRAGTYTILIRDKCRGCVNAGNTVTITEPPFVPCVTVIASVSRNISRPGANDAQITAACSGIGCGNCISGYGFSLNGGAYQNSGIFNGLAPGTYTVTIKDNCTGCTTTSAPVTITAPVVNHCVNVEVTNVLHATAPGGFDGGITVRCAGANCGNCSQGYEYSLNGGPYQASNNFGGLRAGTYTVNIREKCSGCVTTGAPITITEPAVAPCPVISSAVTKHASSESAKDGVIQATCSGNCRCGSFSYSLNGGPFQSLGVFSGLGVGTYVVTMRENCRACISSDTLTIGVSESVCQKAPGIVRIQVLSSRSAVVTWSNVPGVLWYAFEYRDENSDDWKTIKYIYGTTYTLRDLMENTNYSVRVRAHCREELVSDYSPEGSFTTKSNTNPACAAPSFRLTEVSGDMLRMDWAPVLNARCYIVSYQQTGDDEWTEFVLPATARSHYLTDLQVGGAYQIRMKTNCSGCEAAGANTSPYSFVLSYALRKASEITAVDLTLYPNPAQQSFSLRYRLPETARVQVVDLMGKEITNRTLATDTDEVTFDTSEWTNGVYALKISTADGWNKTLKIVISK